MLIVSVTKNPGRPTHRGPASGDNRYSGIGGGASNWLGSTALGDTCGAAVLKPL